MVRGESLVKQKIIKIFLFITFALKKSEERKKLSSDSVVKYFNKRKISTPVPELKNHIIFPSIHRSLFIQNQERREREVSEEIEESK